MRKTGRNSVVFVLVALLITGLSTVALAASEGGEEEGGGAEVTTTTIVSGLSPAVDAGVEEAPPAEVDWTYRYMVPTGLALAALIVLIVSIKYFTDVVRKRYRIVEE
ncbi:MAG TPA: hypothetical protein VFS66_10225 [Acidimicrobiia bacterium]|nr:hypothetical protein [Acidimicrobiia bacterium]